MKERRPTLASKFAVSVKSRIKRLQPSNLAKDSVYLALPFISRKRFKLGKDFDLDEILSNIEKDQVNEFTEKFTNLFDEHIDGFGVTRSKTSKEDKEKMEWKRRLQDKQDRVQKINFDGTKLKSLKKNNEPIANSERDAAIQKYRDLMKNKRADPSGQSKTKK